MTSVQEQSESPQLWLWLAELGEHRNKLALGSMLVAPVVIGIALFTYHLNGSLYGDEWHTLDVISTDDFFRKLLSPSMSHPPLFFALAKLGRAVVGADWGIRLPSLIFALGAVALIPVLAARLLGKKYILCSLWIVATSPFLAEFASEGRPYAMMAFLSCAYLLSLVNFVERQSTRNMLWLLAISLCGLWTHYLFAPQLLVGGCYFLFLKHRSISRQAWAYVALILVALSPSIPLLLQNAEYVRAANHGWGSGMSNFRPLNALIRMPVALTFGYCTFHLPQLDGARNVGWGALKDNWLSVIGCLIWLGAFSFMSLKLLLQRVPYHGLFFLGVVLPVISILLAGWLELFIVREKYLASIFACFILLMVSTARRLASLPWGRVAVACLTVVIILSNIHFIASPEVYSRKSDWNALLKTISDSSSAGDCFIYYHVPQNRKSFLQLDHAGTRQVDVLDDRASDESTASFTKALHEESSGKIFLIVDDGMRRGVDPKHEVHRTLQTLREGKHYLFGRNLALYVYEKIPSRSDKTKPRQTPVD